MPGFLMDARAVATMKCQHGGGCQVVPSQFAVRLNGSPVITMADQIMVVGCPFVLPGGVPSPCVKVVWTGPALAAQAALFPALIQPTPGTGQGLCLAATGAPQGAPIVSQLQIAVRGA